MIKTADMYLFALDALHHSQTHLAKQFSTNLTYDEAHNLFEARTLLAKIQLDLLIELRDYLR